MQQITLTNVRATNKDNSSLPEFIRYFQYNNENSNPYSDANNNNGSIGKGSFAYLIDCMHKCLSTSSEKDTLKNETHAFRDLINTLRQYRSPIISKDFLFKNFVILEIPDYSHEAMSQGMNDFVVYVFTKDGKKIPQRYIGLIKEYSSRICFVLIDKENIWNFINKDETKEADGLLEQLFQLIIEPKRNLELTINENKDGCSDHIFTDKYDYDLYETLGKYCIDTTPENYLYSNYIDLNLPSKVQYQGKTDTIDDYFKQVFANDYRGYLEKNTARSFKRDGSFDLPTYDNRQFEKNFKQESYEFIESVDNIEKYYVLSFPEEFNVFDRNTGRLLIPGKDEDYTITSTSVKYSSSPEIWRSLIHGINLNEKKNIKNIEVIPNFDMRRRLRVSIIGVTSEINKTLARSILKFANFYRWNAKSLDIHIYKNGFLQVLPNSDQEPNSNNNDLKSTTKEDIITVMAVDDLSGDVDATIETLETTTGWKIINEGFSLPSSVNYSNLYTNSYSDNVEKVYSIANNTDNPALMVFDRDDTSKMYFDSNVGELDLCGSSLSGEIQTVSDNYTNLVTNQFSNISNNLINLRKNFLDMFYSTINSLNGLENKNSNFIEVSQKTEFVYVCWTGNNSEDNILKIKIPVLSGDYTFNLEGSPRVEIDGTKNNNMFETVILPVWRDISKISPEGTEKVGYKSEKTNLKAVQIEIVDRHISYYCMGGV